MLEAEYRRRFGIISDEITAATTAFYRSREINQFGLESHEKLQKLSRDGHFWNFELYALQTTWFIVLGRIFDHSSGAYSIHDFLQSTVAYKGFFSKRSLADRKRQATGQSEPEWLNEYLKSAWEPTSADLEKIASKIEPANTKWNEVYKAIRNKVFAHTDANKAAEELFRGTLVGDIEDILHDLNKIRTAIFQLLENGRQYWIADHDRSYASPIIGDTRALLDRL